MRTESKQLEKTMQNRHMCVGAFVDDQSTAEGSVAAASAATDPSEHAASGASSSAAQMEGYLFKRTSKGFKTWNRRWFYLCDNKLMYK